MKDIGYTGAEYLKEEMDSRGMNSEIIWGPSAEDIQSNLRNGKVMLVSVNSNTRFTGASHIMTIVDINTDGQVYIINPSSSTNDGWFEVSELMAGCDYIVVTDAGASGIADTSGSTNTTGYVAVVATWNQSNTTVTTNDPNVNPDDYNSTQYSMTSTTVNYRGMVDRYSMPFDFLWALLVVGEEKEFVFELADLVYNSDIQVTIYDNLTVTTAVDTWHYEQETKNQVDIDITGTHTSGVSARRTESNHEDILDPVAYNTTKTVVTYTNTINQVLTKADTWIVNYTNEYKYSGLETTSYKSTMTKDDEEFPSEPNSTASTYSCEHTNAYKQQIIDEIGAGVEANNANLPETPEGEANGEATSQTQTEFNANQVVFSENYAVRIFNRYINISDNINSTTETKKFTEGTPNVEEKTKSDTDEDGNPEEINFVTIYKKAEHVENRKNINSAAEWLFEIVETNGKPDLDLVKYLLYKATGTDYGVTKYDFSEYDASKFKPISGIAGGTIQEKVWFALKDIGYSDIVAAGAMGNIDYESGGFNPSAIEGGSGWGIGICQWTNPNGGSTGRRQQLEDYARSKGKDWKDEDTQVEFLVTELTGEGPAEGYADYQFMSNNGYSPSNYTGANSVEEATRAFCWTFERPNLSDGYGSMDDRIARAKKYLNVAPNWTRSEIGSGDILSTCEEVMNDMIKRNVHYSTSPDKLIWNNIKASSEHSYACCATYVSIVLYKSGMLTEQQINAYNYNATFEGGISNMLQAAGWHKVSHSEIQPGDVINNYGVHALIYAGGNKVYDQSCGVVSSNGAPPKGGPYDAWSWYSGNSNVEVWRAPSK